MTMTNDEIVCSFNNAAKPAAQVRILADLNGCPEEKIRKILVSGGVDPRRLPRARGAQPSEKTGSGGGILQQVEKEMQRLELRKAQIDELIEKLQLERQQIDPKLQALNQAKRALQEAYGK